MEQRDEDIMADYQSGNDEAITMIFERYKHSILNFSLRLLGNRADAEDVTSEVFLALFSKKYVFQPKAKFSTWLFTIARNSCIDRIRKRKGFVATWFPSKNSEGGFEAWDIEDSSDLSRESLAKKEMAKRVRDSIQKLPLEQKEAIVLREYHNQSYEQIAQILNCTLEKTKILIFRAREQLREDLSSFVTEGQNE